MNWNLWDLIFIKYIVVDIIWIVGILIYFNFNNIYPNDKILGINLVWWVFIPSIPIFIIGILLLLYILFFIWD